MRVKKGNLTRKLSCSNVQAVALKGWSGAEECCKEFHEEGTVSYSQSYIDWEKSDDEQSNGNKLKCKNSLPLPRPKRKKVIKIFFDKEHELLQNSFQHRISIRRLTDSSNTAKYNSISRANKKRSRPGNEMALESPGTEFSSKKMSSPVFPSRQQDYSDENSNMSLISCKRNLQFNPNNTADRDKNCDINRFKNSLRYIPKLKAVGTHKRFQHSNVLSFHSSPLKTWNSQNIMQSAKTISNERKPSYVKVEANVEFCNRMTSFSAEPSKEAQIRDEEELEKENLSPGEQFHVNTLSCNNKDISENSYVEDAQLCEKAEASFAIGNIASLLAGCVSQDFDIDVTSSPLPSLKVRQDFFLDKRKAGSLQKGSDWLKELQKHSTPLKINCPQKEVLEQQMLEPPDSVKKKFKKDGLADQLKKLEQSWKSNVAMWNHQMSQMNMAFMQICSRSPTMQGQVSPIPSAECSPAMKGVDETASQGSSKSERLQTRSQSELPKTPLQGVGLRKLRSSIDISPALSISSSNLSAKNSFLPQKHICFQIENISRDYLSTNVALLSCIEIDECYHDETAKHNSAPSMKLGKSTIHDHTSGKVSKAAKLNLGVVSLPSQLRKYFVMIYLMDETNVIISVGDKIKIFAPWEALNVKSLNMPVIFSSYFIIKSYAPKEEPMKEKKMIPLASQSCSHVPGCDSIPYKLGRIQTNNENVISTLANNSRFKEFDVIQDNSETCLKGNGHIWTVLEALEEIGNRADALVCVTVRIIRIIPFKDPAGPEKDCSFQKPYHFLLLGQDPSGMFLTIRIPNFPLTRTLQSLLDDGEGKTQTLTHLRVSDRVTFIQNPALFSALHSYHSLYKAAVRRSDTLRVVLAGQLSKPQQTFCYEFVVSLGKTKNVPITHNEDFFFKQPFWCFEEILKDECRKRGKVAVDVYYYIRPYLHVTCRKRKFEGKMNEVGFCGDVLYRIIVSDAVWLPPWLVDNDAVMSSAIIRDILFIRAGEFCLDEYSSIVKTSENFSNGIKEKLKLFPVVTTFIGVNELAIVEGPISEVNEQDALSWQECCSCKTFELILKGDKIYCPKCDQYDVPTVTKYSLVVILDDRKDNTLRVKLKLFQKTIENLLSTCQTTSNQDYVASSLLGKKIGPAICIVNDVSKENSKTVVFVSELPY